MNHHQENFARHLPEKPGTVQILIPLEPPRETPTSLAHVASWYGQIMHGDFLPLGLGVWGADETTRIHAIQIGNASNVISSYGAVPASWFSTQRTMAELKELSDRGELVPNGVLPKQLHEMDVAHLGNTLTIDVSGPITAACFFGLGRTGNVPTPYGIDVSETNDGRWQSTITRHGLLRDEQIGRITAPTAEIAAQLAPSLLPARGY